MLFSRGPAKIPIAREGQRLVVKQVCRMMTFGGSNCKMFRYILFTLRQCERTLTCVCSRLSGLGVCLVPQKHACQVFTAATAPLFFPFHFVDLHLIGDSRIGYQICRFLSFRLVLTDPRRFSGSLLWRGLSLDYPSIVPKFGEGGALLHSKSLVGLVRVVQEYVRCEPVISKAKRALR